MSTVVARVRNFVNDKNNTVPITASYMDAEFDQVITALNRKVLVASSSPSSPIEGQTWYDSTNKRLMLYRNTAFDRVDVPPGSITAYGAATAPTGWLLCDGTAVSRTTYADLFAVVSTTFGTGDGSTTFNLPDFRGRFPIGKAASGTGSTLGGTGGTIDHTHTGPSHTHNVTTSNHQHSVPINTASGADINLNATPPYGAGTSFTKTHGVGLGAVANSSVAGMKSETGGGETVASAAGGTGTSGTGNPPFQAVTFIMKY